MATSILKSSKTAHNSFIQILFKSTRQSLQKNRRSLHSVRALQGAQYVRYSSIQSTHLNSEFNTGHRRTFTQIRHFRITPNVCDEIREVPTPAFADSISEGDVNYQKAVGDVVAEDDVVAEVETEKTAVAVPSPVAGEIVELCCEDGATVTSGTILYKIKVGAGGAPSGGESSAKEPEPSKADKKEEKQPEKKEEKKESKSDAGEIPSSPPKAPSTPSGPMTSKPASSVKVTKATSGGSGESAPAAGSRNVTRVKMNPMRRRIASRLKEAQNECAMLTTFNEIDMSNIMQLRTQYKDAFAKKHGLKLGFMSAFLKASAYALTDLPSVNAVIDEAEIVYRDFVDISVAVATPKGLVVPVLRDVHSMNYAQIERGLNDLAEKARSGTLAVEDMDGGTFTISNGGVYGSMFGTPIINLPQSAILGMHGIFDRPVAINGKVEIRPMMYVALTYDHRLIDGREGVTFLKKIKSAVEDPRVMFLDL